MIEFDIKSFGYFPDALCVGGSDEWQSSQLDQPSYGQRFEIGVVFPGDFFEFFTYTCGLFIGSGGDSSCCKGRRGHGAHIALFDIVELSVVERFGIQQIEFNMVCNNGQRQVGGKQLMLEDRKIGYSKVLDLSGFVKVLQGLGSLFKIGNRVEVIKQKDIDIVRSQFC